MLPKNKTPQGFSWLCYYVEAEATCRVGWSSTHLVVLHGSFDYPIYVDAKSLSRLEMHMKCISFSDTWPLTAPECTLWALFVQQQSLWMRLKPTSPNFLFIYIYICILGHIQHLALIPNLSRTAVPSTLLRERWRTKIVALPLLATAGEDITFDLYSSGWMEEETETISLAWLTSIISIATTTTRISHVVNIRIWGGSCNQWQNAALQRQNLVEPPWTIKMIYSKWTSCISDFSDKWRTSNPFFGLSPTSISRSWIAFPAPKSVYVRQRPSIFGPCQSIWHP